MNNPTMERPINYQEIRVKFQTIEEFNGAFDYILKIYEQTLNIKELDMAQADKNRRIKSLNREINRINILFRDYLNENRAQLMGLQSQSSDHFPVSRRNWN